MTFNHTIEGQYIGRIKRIIEVIEVAISEDAIYWIEYLNAQVGHGVFCSVTKKIEKLICNDLFRLDLPFVLTSGTIAVDGDFEYFAKSIGIDKLAKKRTKYLSMKSPFDYQKNSLIYQSIDIPFPDSENNAYIQAITLEIERLIRASHGHALVLFTSYSPLRKVYRLLEEMDFDFPIFRLEKGNQQAIKEYRESKNGVLFACGSMWEGIDFKGDLLSHLIIVKLPFLIPDPITDHQRSLYEDHSGFQQEILIPRMLIRLKQGHGRAIRDEQDTAVISILDSRAEKAYLNHIRTALPKCTVSNDIADVQEFIQKNKSANYFEKPGFAKEGSYEFKSS